MADGSEGPVVLGSDHPGATDEHYLRRRQEIAVLAERYRPGELIPDVRYTAGEDALWSLLIDKLAEQHRRFACAEVVRADGNLALPRDRVPQLREVTARLQELSGFRMEPVPGLVPTRTFYGALADRRFLSTQYLRHPSVPLYTPEPDLAHEVIGHATMLASPMLAGLYEVAGRASLRAETDEALEFFSRVFWYTIEFGVVHEGGEPRAWGAGLLSSFGEIQVFRQAEIRPFDLLAMGTTDYDITQYQPVLFAGRSLEWLVDELTEFFSTYDDDAHARLVARSAEPQGAVHG